MFDAFVARFAGRFGRAESRQRMVSCLRGLLSETERKNGWTLAEAAGGQRGGCEGRTQRAAPGPFDCQ